MSEAKVFVRQDLREARGGLSKALELLHSISGARLQLATSRHCLTFLDTLAELEERSERNNLPASRASGILRDIRLDTILMLTDLDLGIRYDLMEVDAPSEELKEEIRNWGTKFNKNSPVSSEVRSNMASQLRQTLHQQRRDLALARELLEAKWGADQG